MKRLREFITFVSIVIAIIAVANWASYVAVVSIFRVESSSALIAMRLAFIFLIIDYFIAAALTSRFDNILVRIIYKIASVLLGITPYVFMASVLYGFLILVRISEGASHSIGVALMISAALVILYGLIHATQIRIKRYSVSLPNLPDAWKGKSIALVADFHAGQVYESGSVTKRVTLINSLNPDLVIIAGDFFDGVYADNDKLAAPLKGLKAPLGVYFATGNHEEFEDHTPFIDALRNAGVKVLMNEKIEAHGLQIIGMNDEDTTVRESYRDTLQKIAIDRTKPSILIKHAPFNMDIAEEAGYSLQVSGHTHKAQIWPFSLIEKFIYKGYEYGLKPFKSMQVLTTSGIGTWGPPMRVGTDSEVVLIKFQ
jgi:predicted MPP superfamily phosphohydrolase